MCVCVGGGGVSAGVCVEGLGEWRHTSAAGLRALTLTLFWWVVIVSISHSVCMCVGLCVCEWMCGCGCL